MKKINKIITAKDIVESQDWKNNNKIYLKQLQKFLDLAENISDDNLKKKIIYQMLKCDETLTSIMKEICENLCDEKL